MLFKALYIKSESYKEWYPKPPVVRLFPTKWRAEG